MSVLERLGRLTIAITRVLGGVVLLGARVLSHLVRLKVDRREFLRAMLQFGEASIPIVIVTALFTGMIMVLLGAVYVRQFAVYDLVGWYAGFATFREVGPVLIGLMFSGRVGANHTSELATMQITEQLDALRILAIDVYDLLIAPRTVSMVLSMGALVAFGNLVAIVGGALCAYVLLGVEPGAFFRSIVHGLSPADFAAGMYKALAFGGAIALVSSYFGLSVQGGAQGVGRAVNAQVVACALAIFVLDYVLTMLALS